MVGGLLSAYALSEDQRLLNMSRSFAEQMIGSMYSGSNVIPNQRGVMGPSKRRESHGGGSTTLADCGTFSLEFRYLAYLTDDTLYADQVAKIHQAIESKHVGRNPMTFVQTSNGMSSGALSFGSMADSYFEYLLKTYLQGGKTESKWLDLYLQAVKGIHELTKEFQIPGLDGSSEPELVKVLGSSYLPGVLEELTCFVPGMLALGVMQLEDNQTISNPQELEFAQDICYACYRMWTDMPSGIAPNVGSFSKQKFTAFSPEESYYALRPGEPPSCSFFVCASFRAWV